MTRTRLGALLLALTTILWLTAATGAQAHHRDDHDKGGSSAAKNGQPDPEPIEDDEQASRGRTDCSNNAGKGTGGEYDSTCDGTVGRQGGSGNGKCAGCDGRADNKDPKGQYRNDRNNGYECDNNGGVARGNPAHSRCKAPKPDEPPRKPNKPRVPRDIPAPSVPEDTVRGIRIPAVRPGVRPVPATRPSRQRAALLPFTGPAAATQGFALIGLGLIAAGGMLIRPRRRGKHRA